MKLQIYSQSPMSSSKDREKSRANRLSLDNESKIGQTEHSHNENGPLNGLSYTDEEIPRESHNDTISSHSTHSSYSYSKFVCDAQTFNYRTPLQLAAYTILGVSLRVALDQWFGGYVTASGRDEQRGGGLFSDLPANMLGSFIVGFLSLNSIKFKEHIFVGMKTGLCGSLTTFASWNTQMVVMMDGTVNSQLNSQVGSALFGYLIGLEAALMSFRIGKDWAAYFDNYVVYLKTTTDDDSPESIAKNSTTCTSEYNDESNEATKDEQVVDMAQNSVNTMIAQDQKTSFHKEDSQTRSTDIIRNSFSTKSHCRKQIFIYLLELAPIALALCLTCFYIVQDLENKRNTMRKSDSEVFDSQSSQQQHDQIQEIGEEEAIQRTLFFQKLWLCCLLAPFGTILRWKLSLLNNSARTAIFPSWMPNGTFLANLLGSVISIIAVGILDRLSLNEKNVMSGTIENIPSSFKEELVLSLLGALKTGFAGSLSTVSTFVSEIDKLMELHTKQPKGYLYAFVSLSAACLISLCIYIPLVRLL